MSEANATEPVPPASAAPVEPIATPAAPADAEQSADAAAEAPTTKSAMEGRWGKTTIKAGYTMVPSVIFRAQSRLHINAVELAVLMHLLDHWWDTQDMPFPAKKTLADRLGVSTKTVQRAIAALEAEGLVKRKVRYNGHGGQGSNFYDLQPLVDRLTPIADEALDAKKKSVEMRRSVGRNGGLKAWQAREAAPK